MDDKISDGKLTLRAIEQRDIKILYELLNDPKTERSVIGWNMPVSYAAHLKWFNEVLPNDRSIRMMIDLHDNTTIGTLSLTAIDEDSKSGALGIKILRQFQGKTHTVDALILFGHYCFKKKGIYCIHGTCLTSNNASRRLMRLLGSKEEGIQRSAVYKDGKRHDLVHFSIDVTEFRGAR